MEQNAVVPLEDKLPTVRTVDTEVEVPAIERGIALAQGPLATVVQIWEGVVTSVDLAKNSMGVRLSDVAGILEAHTAIIDLQWVVEQDRGLLQPGAVFYWTMYKETKRGSISSSQEIRFRRLPNWSKAMLQKLEAETDTFASKFATTSRVAD